MLTCVCTQTESHVSPALPGNKGLCRCHQRRWSTSVNDALHSSPSLSTPQNISPLVFLEMLCKFGILQVTEVHQIREENCFSFPLRLIVDFNLSFVTSHAGMLFVFEFFVLGAFGFWHLHSFLKRNWFVSKATVKASHIFPFRESGPFVSLHFSACFCILRTDCFSGPLVEFVQVRGYRRLSSRTIHGKARSSVFFQFQSHWSTLHRFRCCRLTRS